MVKSSGNEEIRHYLNHREDRRKIEESEIKSLTLFFSRKAGVYSTMSFVGIILVIVKTMSIAPAFGKPILNGDRKDKR